MQPHVNDHDQHCKNLNFEMFALRKKHVEMNTAHKIFDAGQRKDLKNIESLIFKSLNMDIRFLTQLMKEFCTKD